MPNKKVRGEFRSVSRSNAPPRPPSDTILETRRVEHDEDGCGVCRTIMIRPVFSDHTRNEGGTLILDPLKRVFARKVPIFQNLGGFFSKIFFACLARENFKHTPKTIPHLLALGMILLGLETNASFL